MPCQPIMIVTSQRLLHSCAFGRRAVLSSSTKKDQEILSNPHLRALNLLGTYECPKMPYICSSLLYLGECISSTRCMPYLYLLIKVVLHNSSDCVFETTPWGLCKLALQIDNIFLNSLTTML